MSKDIFDPDTSSNPEGNWTMTGRSNEVLRLAYVLLYNFAKRIEEGNPEKLDQSYFDDLLTFSVPRYSKNKEPESNYSSLMMGVRRELNFFINGSEFGENSALAIRDPDYLDALADVLGDFDGYVGFILSGNPNASEKLLKDLCQSNFYLTLPPTSTRKRAQASLEMRG
jgi:hypothetical protein